MSWKSSRLALAALILSAPLAAGLLSPAYGVLPPDEGELNKLSPAEVREIGDQTVERYCDPAPSDRPEDSLRSMFCGLAFFYYSNAARRGDVEAMEALARLYEEGNSVHLDAAQAAEWRRKAEEARQAAPDAEIPALSPSSE